MKPPGINLHVLLDDQIPENKSNQVIDIKCVSPPDKNWAGFIPLKEKYFGTRDQRERDQRDDSDGSNILELKKQVYHYGIFIHQYKDMTFSGCADPQNWNFVVSLGGFWKVLGLDQILVMSVLILIMKQEL